MLLFEPTTIDLTSVKAIHIENRGKNEIDDQSKKATIQTSQWKIQSEMEREGEENNSSQRRRAALLQSLQEERPQ